MRLVRNTNKVKLTYGRRPSAAFKRKKKWPKRKILLIVTLLVLVATFLILKNDILNQNLNGSGSQDSSFNKKQHSLNDATSIWVVVNKGRALPADYVPPDLITPNVPLRLDRDNSEMFLRREAATALEQMMVAARLQNIQLMLASGYRSYSQQAGLYNIYAGEGGRASADSSSAHPGHSEHQTGLAADLEPVSKKCEVEDCFAQTPEGIWLAANAYKYGFIIRYQQGKESLTGYQYEPWHIRYVGTVLAQKIQQSGQTLEQFFELPIYTDYPSTPFRLSIGN